VLKYKDKIQRQEEELSSAPVFSPREATGARR